MTLVPWILSSFQAEHEDLVNTTRDAEEKSKKAMVDAARLSDELRAEQDHAQNLEKMRKGLEVTVKELQVRLEESEILLQTTGGAAFTRMEARVRELEEQLSGKNKLYDEQEKKLRNNERSYKEISFQYDQDRKNQEKMQDLIDALQQKVRSYKRQIEEAEEIAALNLAKFRKAQQELDEYEMRSSLTTTRTVTKKVERIIWAP